MDVFDTLKSVSNNELSLDNFDSDMYDIYRDGKPFVSIEQFLEDDYYFGKIGKDLYPENKEDLIDIFDPRNTYLEIILAGAIGWGKTFLACIGLSYIIGQLSAYNNPHKWLGASPTSPLVFMNMSVNAKKAKEIIFTRIKSMVDTSPYFKEKFPRNRRLIDSCEWNMNIEDAGTRSGQQIHFRPGTGESLSALGDDIYGGILDELNFFRVIEKSKRAFGEAYDPAQKLYDTVTRRMKSRFMQGGKPLGKLFLISSAQIPEDFIERRIEEAKKHEEYGSTVKLIKKSQWEGKKGVFVGGKPVYGEKRFRVECGTSRKSSRIIDKYDDKTGEVTRSSEESIDGKVLSVPVELWTDFYRDVEGSVRDFGGEVTRAIYPFFPDAEVIYSAVEDWYEHPWERTDTTLADGSGFVKGRMLEEEVINGKPTGKIVPMFHPRKARYWHVDIALSGDALGLAVVHVAGWKQVRTGLDTIEDKPVIMVDLMLKVVPPRGGEINFGNVRSILYQLQQMGFYLRFGSLDLKMMSADFMQIVRTRGLECDHVSVDRDMAPYQVLKDCCYDGRLIMYEYEPVLTELTRLEKVLDKIDHPMDGSKDVSDGLAGAVFNAFNYELGASAEVLKARLPVMSKEPQKPTLKKVMKDEAEIMRLEWGGGKIIK